MDAPPQPTPAFDAVGTSSSFPAEQFVDSSIRWVAASASVGETCERASTIRSAISRGGSAHSRSYGGYSSTACPSSVAAELGITANAAMVRLHRARAALMAHQLIEHGVKDEHRDEAASVTFAAPGPPRMINP
jgi:hypothetical protein